VTKKLGLVDSGGEVRLGAVHYNTLEKIEGVGKVLGRICEEVE
jgi:selenocysteine lyase/cysteine desulfurase